MARRRVRIGAGVLVLMLALMLLGSSVARADTSYDNAVLAAGPVAFWPLDDSSLPTAADVSGNGNNGTFASGVTTGMLDQPGIGGGGSLGLTGDSSAYVEFPVGLLPTSESAFSLELWFKTSSPSGILIGHEQSLGSGDGGSTPLLYVDSSGYLEGTAWYDGTFDTLVSSSPVDDGNWHQVVLTATASGAEVMYLDGVQQATGTLAGAPVWPTTGYATIGAGDPQTWPGGLPDAWTGFDGNVADVAIYGTALSASTINGQYAAGATPVNTATPAITGTPAVGQTLTAGSGSWSGAAPISYSYQWGDCTTPAETSCTDISGATASTYTVQSSDVGSYVAVDVTATNALGSASASSPAGLVAAGSSYAGLVQAAGPAAFWQLNDTMLPTAFDSSGNGNSGQFSLGVTTAGMLDQPGIAGSGSGSLALTGDPSAYVQVPASLLATSGAFTVQAWFETSSAGGVIMGREDEFSASASQYIPMLYVDSSGYLEGALWFDGGGDTLVSRTPVDDGQWHEAVLSVTAAGTQTLTVDGVVQDSGSLGASLQAPAYATIGAGNTVGWPGGLNGWFGFDGSIADVALYDSALSQATIQGQYDAARPAPEPGSLPAVTGTPQVGDTLSGTNPTWTGSGTVSYGYQWEDCTTQAETSCSAIGGATSSTYTVASSDIGSYLVFKVTATNASGSTSVSSSPTALVASTSFVCGAGRGRGPVRVLAAE